MERLIEFVGNNAILFVLLAGVIALIAWTEFRRLTRKYRGLSPTEAVRLINRDEAVVVDIREDAEARKGSIAGARHIPVSVFKQRMSELEKFRERTIVVVCQTGSRSAPICEQLVGAGYPSVAQLRGGIVAWEGAGLPLKTK